MHPLAQSIYNAYCRHDEPVRAEKAIMRFLKTYQKDQGASLAEAHEFVLRQTNKYRTHREYLISTGKSEKKFNPMCASWFNGGGPGGDSSEWEMPPEEKPAFDLLPIWKQYWPAIEEQYGIAWGDPRFWGKTPAQTWDNLPAAVRAELKSLTN